MPQKMIRLPEGAWRVINNSMLLVTDEDTPPNLLVYHLTSMPSSGYLALLPNRSTAVTQFTQQDIDDMLLVYQHRRGAALSDFFYFSVSDGAARGRLESVSPCLACC